MCVVQLLCCDSPNDAAGIVRWDEWCHTAERNFSNLICNKASKGGLKEVASVSDRFSHCHWLAMRWQYQKCMRHARKTRCSKIVEKKHRVVFECHRWPNLQRKISLHDNPPAWCRQSTCPKLCPHSPAPVLSCSRAMQVCCQPPVLHGTTTFGTDPRGPCRPYVSR